MRCPLEDELTWIFYLLIHVLNSFPSRKADAMTQSKMEGKKYLEFGLNLKVQEQLLC